MRDGYTNGLVSYGGNRQIFRSQGYSFEFERAKRVEAALSILEGKWKIVILNRLFARPIWRFSELERAVPGISQRMLSQQLRLLEKCELVKRTVHPQFPPKVEYELTEFGKTLCPAMKTLVDWAMTFPRIRETSRYQPRRGERPFMPRALMNFQHSKGWTCHFIDADCCTPISGYIDFSSFDGLRAFVLRCNPVDVADFDHCVRAWGKGSTWVNLTDEQYAKLKTRIRSKGSKVNCVIV
jgi:DNA-binding HxlR family transcriptional regulator